MHCENSTSIDTGTWSADRRKNPESMLKNFFPALSNFLGASAAALFFFPTAVQLYMELP